MKEEGKKPKAIKKEKPKDQAQGGTNARTVEGEVRILEKLREKRLRDQVSDLGYARQEARQQGRKEGRMEIILNMLKEKFAVSAVSKATGLPEAEILALQAEAGESLKNGKTD